MNAFARLLDALTPRNPAEERRQAREEQRQLEAAHKRLREERRKLLIQRVHAAVHAGLSGLKAGQYELPSLVGQQAIAKMAQEVARIVQREIGRDA